MTLTSRSWRRIEITLWIVGVCLIGGASGATISRWNYQSQQERALFGGPAVASPHRTEEHAPASTADSSTLVVVAEGAHADASGSVPAASNGTSLEPVRVSRPAAAKKRQPAALDPAAVGRIEIPRLGLAAIVKAGVDDETLSRAVGLVPGSARPGQIGNMVLAGHRDTFFRPLRDVKVNDRIRVVAPQQTYEYKVQSVFIVGPEDTRVLESKGVEELTLVTCFPFRFIGPSPDRFIVSAVRVN